MPGDEIQLRIPFTTLMKIALAILLVLILIQLSPVILMIVFAILIAVMLDPLVVWLERHRVRRGFGIAAVAVVLFGLLAAFFVFLVPAMSRQIAEVMKQWPQIAQRTVRAVPAAGSLLDSVRGGPQSTVWLSRSLVAGKFAIEGLTAVVFVLVVAIYLLIEGRQTYAWLISFAPKNKRPRIEKTAQETGEVILAYMRGNVITSIICAIYAFVVLTALHVPVPLLLALIAFVFDFVPVVGTIVMTLPAALLALTVSPSRSFAVVIAYAIYHLIENYLIIPRVYGSQMRLSTLTVLVSIAVGGTLMGVAGAVLALPIAAAYPIIERIWLRRHLPSDTVERHEELEEAKT